MKTEQSLRTKPAKQYCRREHKPAIGFYLKRLSRQADCAANLKGIVKVRILFDLSTSLQWRGRHAVGIVRTEREIASRLLGDETLDVLPVVFQHGLFKALDPLDAAALTNPASSQLTLSGNITDSGLPVEGSKRYSRTRAVLGFVRRGLTRAFRAVARKLLEFVPVPARQEIRQSLIHARQAFHRTRSSAGIDTSLVVNPKADDILFLCGLGWDVIDCMALQRLRAETGMQIVAVIYDLIPVKFPEMLGGQPNGYFLNYFLHMADLSDHVLCISRCTMRDFLEFCHRYNRRPPPTSVFYLGADVPMGADITEILQMGLASRFSAKRYALTVGTFEIRKNYKLLIELWHELVKEQGFDLDLAIVGMPGWQADEEIKSLQASPLYGTRIFWFQKLSDAGLSWLYDNCCVLLYPSLYEGWGLPVIEALLHRRPAIVSARGAIPEAGHGVAMIIDPDDREAWYSAIRSAALDGLAQPRQDIQLPSWASAAETVRHLLLSRSRTRVVS